MTRDQRAIDALSSAIRHPTMAGRRKDSAAFDAFWADLRGRFPRLWDACEVVDLGDHALLLRWPGRDSGDAGDPVVLMAHCDVVPVSDEEWTRPPFGGEVADGRLWGRGAMDDKCALVGLCAAAEGLIEDGFVPSRDVWFSFGSDEEVFGTAASRAVAELRGRGVRPWFVLDEGGAIVDDAVPGVSAQCAMVGLAEKGSASVQLRVRDAGGHASTPPRHTAAGRLARAIVRVEEHPATPRLSEPVVRMLEALGPLVHPRARLVTDRAGALRRPLAAILAAAGPETAALTRTTVAVTQLAASVQENVLPSLATAGLNVRTAIGDSTAATVRRLRRAIRDDAVEVAVLDASEPSPVAPLDDAWTFLTASIGRVFPDVHPIPYVTLGATDGRVFHRAWPNVYRFYPFRLTAAQRAAMHAADENLDVDAYLDGVRFYTDLMEHL